MLLSADSVLKRNWLVLVQGTDVDDAATAITRAPADKEPLSALAFKIMADKFVGSLTFCRIYRWLLSSSTEIMFAKCIELIHACIGYMVRFVNRRAELSQECRGQIAGHVSPIWPLIRRILVHLYPSALMGLLARRVNLLVIAISPTGSYSADKFCWHVVAPWLKALMPSTAIKALASELVDFYWCTPTVGRTLMSPELETLLQ